MRTAGFLAIFGAFLISGCLGGPSPSSTATHGEHEGHQHDGDASDHTQGGGHGHAAGSSSPLVPFGFDVASAPDLTRAPPFPIETGRRPTYEEARGFNVRYQSVRA